MPLFTRNILAWIIAIACLAFLSSCSDSHSLLQQTISFSDSGPISKFVDDPNFINPASGGDGTGSITYASSDPNIATVDTNSGEVSIVGKGTTDIIATKAADNTYAAAQARYTLAVATNQITISAWIGKDNTEIILPPEAQGMSFVRTSQEGCDLANYSVCDHGQLDVITSSSIIDSAATLNRPAWYQLSNPGKASQIMAISGSSPPYQYNSRIIYFNGQLWLIGQKETIGSNNIPTHGTIWSSADGVAWVERTSTAPLSLLWSRESVVFKGKIWMIGGLSTNEIWSSIDGINWQLETSNAAFPARYNHQVVAFQNRLWLIGGNNLSSDLNDIWSSADGINWTQVTANAPFSPRSFHKVSVFNNKLWLIGGRLQTYPFSPLGDIWSSSDGINWVKEVNTASFSARSGFGLITHDNKMWMIGGYDDQYRHDVWSSDDGISWTKITDNIGANIFFNFQLLEMNGRLYLYGEDSSVWSTSDGIHWEHLSTKAINAAFTNDNTFEYQNKLWSVYVNIDNNTGTLKYNVLNSENGIDWSKIADTINVPPRQSYLTTTFNNKMWLIGGLLVNNATTTYLHDIWSSIDGVNWTLETSSSPLPFTTAHPILFNKKLWLTTGSTSSGTIWSSDDGVNWVEHTANISLDGSSIIVFNGKMWLISGEIGFGIRSDIWSSTDGINWTQENTNVPFQPRYLHKMFILNDKLWLMGGRHIYNEFTDCWSTSDGINWTQESQNTGLPLPYTEVIVFRNIAYSQYQDLWSTKDGANWRKFFRHTFSFP